MNRAQLAQLTNHCANPSLSATLGPFYLGMLPAVKVYESGAFGPLDARGVPMSGGSATAGPVYNPVTIAQYALSLIDQALIEGRHAELDRKIVVQLEALVERIETHGDRRGLFVNRWDDAKYPSLRAPWVSGLSQGSALSALLRGHQVLGEERFLSAAHLVFGGLDLPLDAGGVRTGDACGHLWFEEYPENPPTHVLNGFILTLWGILDHARATGSDKAWRWWNAGVDTLEAHVGEFDCGFWSVYDLKYRELCSEFYQLNVHVPQMEVMYRLTGLDVFAAYGERWRRFGETWWSRAMWWTALRVHARLRRLRSQRIGRA